MDPECACAAVFVVRGSWSGGAGAGLGGRFAKLSLQKNSTTYFAKAGEAVLDAMERMLEGLFDKDSREAKGMRKRARHAGAALVEGAANDQHGVPVLAKQCEDAVVTAAHMLLPGSITFGLLMDSATGEGPMLVRVVDQSTSPPWCALPAAVTCGGDLLTTRAVVCGLSCCSSTKYTRAIWTADSAIK